MSHASLWFFPALCFPATFTLRDLFPGMTDYSEFYINGVLEDPPFCTFFSFNYFEIHLCFVYRSFFLYLLVVLHCMDMRNLVDLPDVWGESEFWLLKIKLLWPPNKLCCMGIVCVSLRKIASTAMTGLCGRYNFKFSRKCQTMLKWLFHVLFPLVAHESLGCCVSLCSVSLYYFSLMHCGISLWL